jgi:SRSO17 transposase
VNTSEYAAVAAAHSVFPDRWWTEFSAVIDRIAPRFARYEPLRHAAELMAGMVSGLDRKNCWTIAEHRGDATPDGLQHLLSRAKWDADAVRDDLRGYVVDHFADPHAILAVDETGDVKKGAHSVGVQRQYTGTAGRIENAGRLHGRRVSDLRGPPRARVHRPGSVPAEVLDQRPGPLRHRRRPRRRRVRHQTGVGGAETTRAVEAAVPAAWIAGDEVYGADPRLRATIRRHGLGYVLQIAANRRVPTEAGPLRVDQLPGLLPSWAWQRRSAGAGSKAHRYYSWAWIELLPQGTGDTGDEQGQHSVGFRTRVPRALIVALFRWRTGTTLPSTA